MKNDEIFLQSDEVEQSPPLPQLDEAAVTEKLRQINTAKTTARRLAIFKDHYLYVKNRSLLGDKEYVVDLAWLDPHPQNRWHIPWKWIMGFICAASLGAVYGMLAFAFHLLPGDGFIHAVIVALCTAVSLGCLMGVAYFTQHFHVYVSRFGAVELVSLLPQRPTQERYKHFCEALQRRAERCKPAPADERPLAQAMRAHRTFRDTGIIDDTQYDAAKQKILNHHD